MEDSDILSKIEELTQQISNAENELYMLTTRVSTIEIDTYNTNNNTHNLENDIFEIRRYLDYIADTIITLNKRLLNMSDYSAYSYYNKPVRDEYGNIIDAAYDVTYTANSNNYSPNQDELLRIDKSGNVWINGQLENSAVKIGHKILELAAMYRDNTPFNTISDII